MFLLILCLLAITERDFYGVAFTVYATLHNSCLLNGIEICFPLAHTKVFQLSANWITESSHLCTHKYSLELSVHFNKALLSLQTHQTFKVARSFEIRLAFLVFTEKFESCVLSAEGNCCTCAPQNFRVECSIVNMAYNTKFVYSLYIKS